MPCGIGCGGAMAADAPIDSGAILARLDSTDRWHAGCVDTFRQLRPPLATSEAALTELFHLVGDSRHDEACAAGGPGAEGVRGRDR